MAKLAPADGHKLPRKNCTVLKPSRSIPCLSFYGDHLQ